MSGQGSGLYFLCFSLSDMKHTSSVVEKLFSEYDTSSRQPALIFLNYLTPLVAENWTSWHLFREFFKNLSEVEGTCEKMFAGVSDEDRKSASETRRASEERILAQRITS